MPVASNNPAPEIQEISFAQKLRAWRKANDWLAKEAADFLGVPIDTYRAWEKGPSKPHETPSRHELEEKMESRPGDVLRAIRRRVGLGSVNGKL